MSTDLEAGYADGWNTPGWTTQQHHLPDATPGVNPWYRFRLPDGITIQPVSGKWRDMFGPAWGNLKFTPSVRTVLVNGVELELQPFRINLWRGSFPSTFGLPIPEDGVVTTPETWYWDVTGRIGPRNVKYRVSVPNLLSEFVLNVDGIVPTT